MTCSAKHQRRKDYDSEMKATAAFTELTESDWRRKHVLTARQPVKNRGAAAVRCLDLKS